MFVLWLVKAPKYLGKQDIVNLNSKLITKSVWQISKILIVNTERALILTMESNKEDMKNSTSHVEGTVYTHIRTVSY